MDSVRNTLRSSPFQFVDDNARIITGEDEGLSSWVTVNYAQGNFFKLIKVGKLVGIQVFACSFSGVMDHNL